MRKCADDLVCYRLVDMTHSPPPNAEWAEIRPLFVIPAVFVISLCILVPLHITSPPPEPRVVLVKHPNVTSPWNLHQVLLGFKRVKAELQLVDCQMKLCDALWTAQCPAPCLHPLDAWHISPQHCFTLAALEAPAIRLTVEEYAVPPFPSAVYVDTILRRMDTENLAAELTMKVLDALEEYVDYPETP